MTEEMQTSWRYLNSASSRFSTVRGYLKRNLNETQGQSWKEWAGQKIKFRRGEGGGEDLSMEKVTLFPGWATRRYGDAADNETFGIDVFVSGFATSHRSTEQTTRSQRAFIRVAKGFASLPKLAADVIAPHSASEPPTPLQASPSTESILAHIKLPPRPTEIPANYDIEALELEFQRVNAACDDGHDSSPGPSRVSSVDDYFRAHAHGNGNLNQHSCNPHARAAADILRRQHANLERRLQPFWSSAIPSRTVHLRVFAPPPLPTSSSSSEDQYPNNPAYSPVCSQDVVTAADGSFQALFRLKWDDLCLHPGALYIAFGDKLEEYELLLSAELTPSVSAASSSSSLVSVQQQSHPRPIYPHRDQKLARPSPSASTLHISLTHSPIRVISDIDDTVKLSNMLLGARAVFHSVFVKDLHENIIPGMGEWYTQMWSRGVRFHYVSNGPFEILPVINEFLQISQLPLGSIKLKSYAGRSLLTGLLSAPATRKRAGVVDILTSFPDSRFFLIGDSGEQDLELYADLARERPQQILAVLIRDADSTYDPIEDPTGWKAIGAAGTRSDPLLSTSRSLSADDGARPRRTLSGLLGRAPPSSYNGKALSSANDYPGAAKNVGGNGSVDYFMPMRFTSEPESEFESDTTPSSTPSTSPHVLSQNPGSNPIRKVNVKTTSMSAPTPVPPMSPYAYGYGSHLSPFPSPAPSLGSRSSNSSSASRISMSLSLPGLSDAEKKRNGLQMRVYRARTQMPGHVPLRVFRDPKECIEVEEVLEQPV